MPDWAIAFFDVMAGTVPLAGLLVALHDRNRRNAAAVARKLRKRARALDRRLDHLDECLDTTKEGVFEAGNRVGRLEMQLSDHMRRGLDDRAPGLM